MKGKWKEEEQGDGNKRIRKDLVFVVSRDPQENEPDQVNMAMNIPQEDEPDDPDIALTTTIDPITGKIFLWYDWLADSATTSHVTN